MTNPTQRMGTTPAGLPWSATIRTGSEGKIDLEGVKVMSDPAMIIDVVPSQTFANEATALAAVEQLVRDL